jgi:sulfur relay (sulfurtransferase) complex TusBCD TusD component (DsrE family)
MDLRGKKLGVLIAARPEEPNFRHGIKLAEAAVRQGATVYLYCIDDAVLGVSHPELQALQRRGLHLYACAYAAQKRNLPISDAAIFAGLGIVSDLIARTDRFVSFN